MHQSRTYFLFAGLNLLWIPVVFFLFPETSNRSLESIEAMFSTSSPLFKNMEKAYRVGNEGIGSAEHEDEPQKTAAYMKEHA